MAEQCSTEGKYQNLTLPLLKDIWVNFQFLSVTDKILWAPAYRFSCEVIISQGKCPKVQLLVRLGSMFGKKPSYSSEWMYLPLYIPPNVMCEWSSFSASSSEFGVNANFFKAFW